MYLPCPGGGWRHFSPDTVTCLKKNAARGWVRTGAGVHRNDALIFSATPSPLKYITSCFKLFNF